MGTTIPLRSIRGMQDGTVLVWTADGFTQAVLDGPVELDTSQKPPVLRVLGGNGAATPWKKAIFTLDNAQNSFPIAEAFGELDVFRNGLMYAESVDYTVENNIVEFTVAQAPVAGDVIVLRYR